MRPATTLRNPRCRKCSACTAFPAFAILSLGGPIESIRSGNGLLPGDALQGMEGYRARYGQPAPEGRKRTQSTGFEHFVAMRLRLEGGSRS